MTKKKKEQEKNEESEEISFDLQKITGFFRRFSKKSDRNKGDSTEPEERDIRFFAIRAIPIVLLIILIVLSINIRTIPSRIEITEDWAQSTVYNSIKSDIARQVDLEYPKMSEDRKNELINHRFSETIQNDMITQGNQQFRISDYIQQLSEQFKAKFQEDESGHVYLNDLDTYYYFRLGRNLVENGYQWDLKDENGRYHDTKIYAGLPLGRGQSKAVQNFHVWAIAALHKTWRVFDPDVSLLETTFYISVLFATLAIIPAFFIARRFAGDIGGFAAGLIVALHPSILARTVGGVADTDAYNIFFPLLSVWLIIEAFYARKFLVKTILTVTSALSIGLYAYSWHGWTSTFLFILVSMIGYLGYQFVVHFKEIKKNPKWILIKKDIRETIYLTGIFFVSSGIFVSFFRNFQSFANIIINMKEFTEFKLVGVTKIWPNVYTTVAELNPANVSSVISQISYSSKLFLLLGLMGLVFTLIAGVKDKEKYSKEIGVIIGASAVWYLLIILIIGKTITSHVTYAAIVALPLFVTTIYFMYVKREVDVRPAIIIGAWFCATLYSTSNGVRFILLMAPAFALLIGIAAGMIYQMASKWFSETLSINKYVVRGVFIALLLVLVFYPTNIIHAGERLAYQQVPMMNDDWYFTLTKIRDETPEDSIINSWWDFGHWFAAIGERAVTLDGGRQNHPAAHWLGKLMVTKSEKESAGILRYLDCGSNSGFDLVNEQIGDEYKSIQIVQEIIMKDREGAKEYLLEQGIEEDAVSDILERTHCDPPENYFITSEDMVAKSGVWAHFGTWNFTKATMFNKVYDKDREEGEKILKDYFGLSAEHAKRMYNEVKNANADQWISAWPSYASSFAACQEQNEGLFVCGSGIVYNPEAEEAYFPTQNGEMRPKSFSFIDKEGKFRMKYYDNPEEYLVANNGRPLSAAFVPSGDTYKSILMDYELDGSMFTRLFFFQGHGLEYFDKFYHVRDVTGANIWTWKVDWEGKDANEVFGPEESETEEETTVNDTIMLTDSNDSNEVEQEDPTGSDETQDYTDRSDEDAIVNMTDNQPEKEMVLVKHILVSTEERSGKEAKKLAEGIIENITESNFDEMAEQFSECSDSREDWMPCEISGMIGRDWSPEEFANAAFELKPGEVSEPVLTKYGYEIIKLIDVKYK